MSIPGLSFDRSWKQRVEADFDDLVAPFISRIDPITSKLAAGRPQDLIDAALLSQVEPYLPKRTQRKRSKKKKQTE